MCKLFTITGPLTENAALGAIDVANQLFARSQPHGFGFVAQGTVDGVKPATAVGRYEDPDKYTQWQSDVPRFFRDAQLEEGTFPGITNVLMVHGRTSTNAYGLVNCHPFHSGSTYLVHNGILDWRGAPADKPQSLAGCDSEQFLNWWVRDPDNNSHPNVLSDAWSGRGAIFILTEGKLKLIKDNTTSLFGAQRAKGGWVWSTDKSDGERICSTVGIALTTRFMKVPPVICDFNELGNPVNDSEWTGFATRTWDALAGRSLGTTGSGFEYGGCGTYYNSQSNRVEKVSPPLSKRQRKKLEREFNKRVTPAKYQLRKTESFPDWEGGSTRVKAALTYNDRELLDNTALTER